MSLANIKLIATDMDGTLLNSNHRVSEHFFSLFKSLMQYNIIFVAASGRPYYSIIDKLDSIKDNITVIAENGGIVIKNNAVLHSKPINKKKLKDITTKLSTLKDISVIYCTKNKAFIKVSDSNLIETFSEYYPNFKRIDSTNEISEDIIKLALYHNDCSEKHIYPHFKHLELNYNIKVSGKNWLDISDKDSNKGNAIKMLQKTHNISPKETLTFGDYNNDIEMLKQSTYSYAMNNAHQNVKNIANFNTKSNDEFGVEIVLEKLLKAKKSN